MKKIFILLTLLFLGGCIRVAKSYVALSFVDGKNFLIENVSVFSGRANERIRRGQYVLIENGVIKEISSRPIKATVDKKIDGREKMLLPGLIDLHTHLGSSGSAPGNMVMGDVDVSREAFLFTGVTTVLDLFGDAAQLQAASEKEQGRPRARYLHAGKAFTAVNGHPAFVLNQVVPWPLKGYVKGKLLNEIEKGADIPALISENKKHGAAITKVFVDRLPEQANILSVAQLKSIAGASEKAKLPIIAHIGSDKTINRSLDAGITMFAHGPYKDLLSKETLQRMKEAGVVMMPTAIVWHSVALFARNRTHFTRHDVKLFDPAALQSYREERNVSKEVQEWFKLVATRENFVYENIKNMRKYKIRLIAASDSPNAGLAPGSAIVKEIMLWVERCGYDARSAVAAATHEPGQLLAEKFNIKGLGVIEPGAQADLLMIKGDFEKNIKDLFQVAHVFKGGRLVYRGLKYKR